MRGARHEGEALSWATDAEGLCTLSLHREPLNELGEVSLAELECFVQALKGEAIRAVLVRSTLERGFCAGADLRALHARLAEGGLRAVLPQVRGFVERIHAVFRELDLARQPIVAAVRGVVFGGGLELALTCDAIVAERDARFAFPELRLGLVPGFGGTVRLRRALGASRLLDLLLTGRSLNAERAHDVGLVSQLAGKGKAERLAQGLLRQTLKLPPQAIATAKRLVKRDEPDALHAEREAFLELFASPHCAAALASFAARTDALPYTP